jgi:serine/threonine protein phosphatase PrpC
MVTDEQIAGILTGATDVDDIASRLINVAKEAGGKDNISVVVCGVH